MNELILVTGSSGYIGGQTSLTLADRGYNVVGVDRRPQTRLKCFERELVCDFSHNSVVDTVVNLGIRKILHIAGSSLVTPSIGDPAVYYANNVGNTAALIAKLARRGWQGTIVYSSSAGVYSGNSGNEADSWLAKNMTETGTHVNPQHPYGMSKLYAEQVLRDSAFAYGITAVCLRYFNVAGADLQGRHGQEHNATHLVARACESAVNGSTLMLHTRKNDSTKTCVRDYIHVEDVADAHVHCMNAGMIGFACYNIGSGHGCSSVIIAKSVQTRALQDGLNLAYQFANHRDGDPDRLVADISKIQQELGWSPKNSDINTIVESAWRWYTRNKQ